MKISLRLYWKPIYWLCFVIWLTNSQDCTNDVNSVLKDGICSCRTSYELNSQNKCQLDCGSLENAKNQLNTTNCQCINNFVWDSLTSTCLILCSEYKFSTGIREGPSDCLCKQNFKWDGKSCSIDCTQMQHSNRISATYDSCQCVTEFYWNGSACVQTCTQYQYLLGTRCYLDCSILENTDGSFNQTTCTCISGFSWNGSACVQVCNQYQYLVQTYCYFDCSLFGYSDGQLNRTTCSCLEGFFWNGFNCTLNCSEIPNSNGYNEADSGCNCQVGYSWNASQIKCDQILECSLISNSNGTNGSGGCICIPNFYWNQSSQTCLINCSQILNTAGSISTDKCSCLLSYSWSGDSCLLNCSEIPNAQNLTMDKSSCNCKIGYFWHPFNNSCVQVNCSSIRFAESAVSITMWTCANKFKWNLTTLRCDIDCLLIQSSNGQVTNPNSFSCKCAQKFFWNTSLLLCQINCSQVANSYGQASLTMCKCWQNFDWDPTGKCVVNCLKDPKSSQSQAPLPLGHCKCQTYYVWNTTLGYCKINCEKIFGTVGEPPDNEKCRCARYSHWSPGFFRCIPNCPMISGSNGILDLTTRIKCGCLGQLTWQSKPMACK